MTYTIDLHKHVKIWLSPDKDVFMPAKNQTRLIEMRKTNPADTICLFYDSKLLTQKAQAELQAFCAQHNIIPKDLRNTVFLDSELSKVRAITCYEQEVDHLHEGGNLGAASDIARLLTYRYGNYSDLDVVVNTTGLPPTITVDQPILFNLGSSYVMDADVDVESIWFNGDVILASDSPETEQMMKTLREGVYKSYTENVFSLHLETYKHHVQELCKKPAFKGTSWEAIYDQTDLQYITMLSNFRKSHPIAPWELRNLISQLTEQQIAHASTVKHNLLMKSVICTTGAELAIRDIFNKGFYTKKSVESDIMPYSLIHHHLDKAFYSLNSAPFHMKADETFFAKEGGDLSWTQMGKAKLDKQSRAQQAPKGTAPLFNGSLKEETEKTLTELTAIALADNPSAKWTYYSAKTGTNQRSAQIWLTVNSKQAAEDVEKYLAKNEVKGLKISQVKDSPKAVLILVEPNLPMLRSLPVMPKVKHALEEKDQVVGTTPTS
jgi:hypothetical protein